ncbi:hypothetical protein SLS59_009618 [Nothophoma quercina]|uniref:Uncharacterized protein n=1 Tax=Nothophoma quercina TaxID=749835 RepID=A0ABR3QK35_9PLEO
MTASLSTRSKRRKLDAATLGKQEIYRQKGEARRRAIAANLAASQTLARRPSPTSGDLVSKPLAKKRRKVTPSDKASEPGVEQSTRHTATTAAYRSVYGGPMVEALMSELPPVQSSTYDTPVIELPPPNPDEMPQAIVNKYEDYKWSVFRYELLADFDHAERWLEEFLYTTMPSEFQRRHCSHISNGFIKDGGPRSLLVLHNAANPFEYEPPAESTTTIGVYGYHWFHHSEIHWTTLGSDQRALLAHCVHAGVIEEKHKWTHDAAKATEKRFHRAYWLAANRRDVKDLLNRGPSDDKPCDLIEDGSEEDPNMDWTVSEADLTNAWDVTDAEAAAAWQKVQDEVDALGKTWNGLDGWQHVVISSSEW